MARPVVILFARAPRLGQVKRRLAAGIGPVPALRFYRNQLARMVRELRSLKTAEIIVAMTPLHAKVRPALPFARIHQSSGDLGTRMANCFAAFRRRPVILIGADIPRLNATVLRTAIHALKSYDAAFGPAQDGGYYLVAMGTKRPSKPFHHIRWSTPDALADTLNNFGHHRVAMLPALQDVDTADDLSVTMKLRIAANDTNPVH